MLSLNVPAFGLEVFESITADFLRKLRASTYSRVSRLLHDAHSRKVAQFDLEGLLPQADSFLTPQHKAALAKLLRELDGSRKAIALVGRAGVGKHLIVKATKKLRKDRVRFFHLQGGLMCTDDQLLEELNVTLQLNLESPIEKAAFYGALEARMKKLERRNLKALLIVDHADYLDMDKLQLIKRVGWITGLRVLMMFSNGELVQSLPMKFARFIDVQPYRKEDLRAFVAHGLGYSQREYPLDVDDRLLDHLLESSAGEPARISVSLAELMPYIRVKKQPGRVAGTFLSGVTPLLLGIVVLIFAALEVSPLVTVQSPQGRLTVFMEPSPVSTELFRTDSVGPLNARIAEPESNESGSGSLTSEQIRKESSPPETLQTGPARRLAAAGHGVAQSSLEEVLRRSESWLTGTNAEHFTLQLLGSSSLEETGRFLANHRGPLPLALIATSRQNDEWYLILSGSYPNIKAARNDIPKVAEWIDQAPWIRRLGDLKQQNSQ